ncbi:FHIPEP family type III secretion protein [Rhizobium helianthi]|uniref:FHIPEP family type III secretion protein n=1 Tax=Rhizobium helianthi TaxID=1132695 RepID=A0ABW4M2C6_9HYPH
MNTSLTNLTQMLLKRTEILFSIFFVVIVAMMILPLPPVIIDTLIGFNLAFSFVVLITTIYLKTALDISTFPAIILIGTIFRLALTISSTRLILAEGHAGEIIIAFGSFVVAGNVVVGLVVFLIVALVQFIVVTKGAERIAEVGARFTLDAMPGKQLAIDSDLRNGHITPQKALQRREQLELESQFFGAMDGSLRFVKGDAIASLVVVAVNLVGGLAIGMFQRGMSFSEAAHLYSLLSIGDGLVAQIPSMLMAIAAGTVVTRVSSDDAVSLGQDIGRQLSKDARALGVAGAMTFAMGFVPGFPATVLWPLGLLLGGGAYLLVRPNKNGKRSDTVRSQAMEQKLLSRTKFGDPIVATVSEATLDRLENANFAAHLETRIGALAHSTGVAVTLPTFNVDTRIADNIIHVQVENVPAGVVDASPEAELDTIAIGLCRIVRRHVGPTFSVEDVAQWLSSLEGRLGRLASQVQDDVPQMVLVQVIRTLLSSGVTLSQPRGLLEALLANKHLHDDPATLAEIGRKALGEQVAYGMLDVRGVLSLINFGGRWEAAIEANRYGDTAEERAIAGETLASLSKLLGQQIDYLIRNNIDPVGLVDSSVRAVTQSYLASHNIHIPLISSEDIPAELSCEILSSLDVSDDDEQEEGIPTSTAA